MLCLLCALCLWGVEPLSRSALADDATVVPARSGASSGCGVYALAIGLRRLKSEPRASYAQCASIVDADGDGVCSLEQLAEGFRHFGVEAVPMHSEGRMLPHDLAVLLVRGSRVSNSPDHFVLLERT